MKETVSVARAATAQGAVLPARVQEALGELVGAAKEGLLALSVGVGLGVLAELMEEEVDDVVGPKGRRNPDRTAVRQHVEQLALSVVVRTGQAHDRRAAVGVYDLFDQPSPRTDLDQLAGLREALGQRLGRPRVRHLHADSVPPLARR